MDPLSITAAALGISQVAFAASKSIYSFIQGARAVDQSVRRLHHRTSSISQILENLAHALEKSHLVLLGEENHKLYKDVNDSVDSCRVTVFKLSTKLQRVTEPKSGIKQGWRYATLSLMQQEIDAILSEMDTQAINLQLSLQIINVSVSAASGAVVLDIQLHIEKLERMMIALDRHSNSQSLPIARTVDALPDNVLLDEHTASLRHTADSVISSASTAGLRSEMEDVVSRISDSDEPAFQYFGNITGRTQIQDSTTGSEFGKPLDLTQEQHIQEWIPEPPSIDERSEPGSSSSKTPMQNSISTSPGAVVDSNPSEITTESITEILEESEDDDVEFQVAQGLLSRGTAHFTEKRYEEALELIQIALSQVRHFGIRRKEALRFYDMQLQLAICYLRTGALVLSEELLLAATKEPLRDEKSKERVLCAFHNLSHLHLQRRNFEAAESHCRQALTGRGKMPSIGKNHDDYFLSLRLRALIFWARGDKRQAEVCIELLPEDKRLTAFEFDQILADEFKEISDSPIEQQSKSDAPLSSLQSSASYSSGTIQIEPEQVETITSLANLGGVHLQTPDTLIDERNDRAQAVQRTIEGHSSAVNAVAFSPDGRLVASGSTDGTLRLWDVATGEAQRRKRFFGVFSQRTIKEHSDSVLAVAFSPNGRLVASASSETIKLWDVATGEVQCKIKHKSYGNFFQAVAFSPNGRLVASGSSDKTVRLWDVVTGEAQRMIEGHSDWVRAVAFSPNGRLVASGSDDMTVRLWNVVTGEAQRMIEGHSDWVRAVAFSPDGRLVASGSWDKTVRLWDVVTGEAQRIIEGHSDQVRAVAFSPDGRLVASGSWDKIVRLWDVATGEAQRIIKGHSGSVMAIAFSPDGRLVASGSSDRTVRLWDIATG